MTDPVYVIYGATYKSLKGAIMTDKNEYPECPHFKEGNCWCWSKVEKPESCKDVEVKVCLFKQGVEVGKKEEQIKTREACRLGGILGKKLERIAEIIESVDGRCMAAE